MKLFVIIFTVSGLLAGFICGCDAGAKEDVQVSDDRLAARYQAKSDEYAAAVAAWVRNQDSPELYEKVVTVQDDLQRIKRLQENRKEDYYWRMMRKIKEGTLADAEAEKIRKDAEAAECFQQMMQGIR